MIESGEKRMDVRFVRSEKRALHMHSDPRFKSFKICDDDLVLEFMGKSQMDLIRHWPVGFTILELSKFVMQSLFYKVIRPTFKNEVSLIFSDTDSFGLLLPVESANKAIAMLDSVMDYSNLDPQNALYDMKRKNCPGYLKNESPNAEIVSFVALKAKTYAYLTKDNVLNSKCKGVKKNARKKILFDSYKQCIFSDTIHKVGQYSLGAKDHRNRLMHAKKTAFSSFDDKRYLLCSIHSVPYGSWLIEKHKQNPMNCYFCENPNVLR